jgi:hypothetical protein
MIDYQNRVKVVDGVLLLKKIDSTTDTLITENTPDSNEVMFYADEDGNLKIKNQNGISLVNNTDSIQSLNPKDIPNLVLALDAGLSNDSLGIYAADMFSRADGSGLGSTDSGGSKTWAERKGTFGISSAKARTSNLDGGEQALATIQVDSADVLVEADILIENNIYSGFVLRYEDLSNYILVLAVNWGIYVKSFNNGTPTLHGFISGSKSFTVGSTIHLVVRLSGNRLCVAANEESYGYLDADFSAFTSTNHGLALGSTTARVDTFCISRPENRSGLNVERLVDSANAGWIAATSSTGALSPVISNSVLIPKDGGSGMDCSHPYLHTKELTVLAICSGSSLPDSIQAVVTCGKYGVSGVTSLMSVNEEIHIQDTNFGFPSGITTSESTNIISFIASASGFDDIGPGVKIYSDGKKSFRRGNLDQQTWVGTPTYQSSLFRWGGTTGGSYNYPWLGNLQAVYIWSRAITDGEFESVKKWAESRYRITESQLPTMNLVFDGDSLTAGALGSDLNIGKCYVSQVLLDLNFKFKAWNVAVHGQKMTEMLIDAESQVDVIYDSTMSNICFVWAGTNDMYGQSNKVDETFTALKSYCNGRKSAGFSVVVLTCLPRGDNAQFEIDRQSYNTAIRNDTSFYNVLADVGSNELIGLAGKQNDETYYAADAIHLLPAGFSIVSQIVSSAINSI